MNEGRELAVIPAMTLFKGTLRHPFCEIHLTEDRMFTTPKGEMSGRYRRIIEAFDVPYSQVVWMKVGGFGNPFSFHVKFQPRFEGSHWWEASRKSYTIANRDALMQLRATLPEILSLNGKVKLHD